MLSLFDELVAQDRIHTTLEDFVMNPPFPAMENDQTRRIAGLAQADQKDGPQMLEEAKRNLRTHFAVVGLTERIDETLCLMHRFFGWKEFDFYYPRNVTLRRTESQSVQPHLKQLIAERNSLDIQLHEFAKEMLDEAIANADPDFHSELKKYKDSIKSFVEQTSLDSIESMERKKVHQFVLEMINKGKTR